MKRYKGNIAIITVVSMIAITLVVTLALSISNVNYKLSTIGFVASTNISQQIQTCKEEALRKISREPSFVGEGTVSFENESCTYTISIDSSNTDHRVIDIETSYSDYYKTATFKVDTSTSPIVLL